MEMDLRRTLDSLPALVSTVDRALRYRFVNREHRRWFGVEPDAMVGQTLWAAVGPALETLMRPSVERALAGEAVDVELQLPATFDLRWARLAITPERDDDGGVEQLHFLVTDLSRERALARRLERSEAIFNAAFAAAGVGKALVDDDGTIRQVNPAFAAMLGYAPEQMAGLHFEAITHPDDIDADLEQFGALARGEIDGYKMEKRYIGADGAPVDALLTVAVVRATARLPQFYVAQILDLRARKRAEQGARERDAELALALETMDGGVWRYAIATGLLRSSDRLAAAIGLPAEREVPFEAALERVHPDDRATLAAARILDEAEGQAGSLFRMRGSDGAWRWLRWRRQQVRDERGVAVSVLGIVFDVTEEQQREARLAAQAITDPLTGLLNRRGFDANLHPAMQPMRKAKPALLIVDLDRFKPINDAYGHAMGDRVLREVGRRLRGVVRSGDVVARLGGDEFAVLLVDADRLAAESAATRIVEALGLPFRMGLVTVEAGASVGVATASAWDDPCTLMKRADGALYAVKRAGRGAWEVAA